MCLLARLLKAIFHTEALIEDIEVDKRVALNCLARPGYQAYAKDPHFSLASRLVVL